ncbi:MAG: hypothetical protein FWE07_05765 [Turicibacter sp.]|nr:hypothetical protein [Turicibacter sp.]
MRNLNKKERFKISAKVFVLVAAIGIALNVLPGTFAQGTGTIDDPILIPGNPEYDDLWNYIAIKCPPGAGPNFAVPGHDGLWYLCRRGPVTTQPPTAAPTVAPTAVPTETPTAAPTVPCPDVEECPTTPAPTVAPTAAPTRPVTRPALPDAGAVAGPVVLAGIASVTAGLALSLATKKNEE